MPMTIPATCENGVTFDVTVNASDLAAGDYAETIRATKGGWDPADCVLSLAVRPEGMPAKR